MSYSNYIDPEEQLLRDHKRSYRIARGMDPDFSYPAYRFATVACLEHNIPHFIQTFGIEFIGFLMLTFPNEVTVKEARRRFNNLGRRFLPEISGHSITIVEFTKRGRVHFHILLQCREDIRTGFDFAAYTGYKRANESCRLGCRQRRIIRDAIPANEALREIWRKFDNGLTDFGLGPVYDLFPIEKNETAVTQYLAKQFLGGLPRQQVANKGVRLVSYSRGCPRAVLPGWRPPSQWFNQRLAALLRVFGLQDRSQFKEILGRRWAYPLFRLIGGLDFDHTEEWPTLMVGDLARIILHFILKDSWGLHYYLEPLLPNVQAMVEATTIPMGPPPPPAGSDYGEPAFGVTY